jgi:hypothetical protein
LGPKIGQERGVDNRGKYQISLLFKDISISKGKRFSSKTEYILFKAYYRHGLDIAKI